MAARCCCARQEEDAKEKAEEMLREQIAMAAEWDRANVAEAYEPL